MVYCKIYTKLFLTCIFLCICAHDCIATIGRYPIRNFYPRDYNAGIQNNDFAQNDDQNLFIANNLGILAYDGSNWELHRFETGRKKRSLLYDRESERLYVGSQGGIGYLDGDWEYHSLADLIPEKHKNLDEVWNVLQLDRYIYFFTFDVILAYDGETISPITIEGGFQHGFNVNSTILVQSRSGLLLELHDHQIVQRYPLQHESPIAGITEHQDGYLIFYNSGEVIYYNILASKYESHPLTQELNGLYLNDVSLLSDNRLVISTQTRGVFIYNKIDESLENIASKDGLSSDACLASFQDYSGNLWVGMQSGLALVDINAPMRLIDESYGIQGSGYDAYQTAEGKYYSSSNGVYFLADGQRQAKYISGTEGPAYNFHKIADRLYVCHHSGLFLLQGTTAQNIAKIEGLWNIKQLHHSPEYIIGGTYQGLHLFKLDEHLQLISQGPIKGFDESSRFFEEDRKGNIWVSQFYKGLYKLTLSVNYSEIVNIKKTNQKDKTLNNQLVLSKIDNELHLGTRNGIYLIDQATDSLILSQQFNKELPPGQIYLLDQDNKKNVHIFGENISGYFKKISSDNYQFTPSPLSQLKYELNNDLLNISTTINEGIYINGHNGFISFNPEIQSIQSYSKRPIIKEVRDVLQQKDLLGHSPFTHVRDSSVRLTTDHSKGALKFIVQSFHFKNVHEQLYRYYLEGFDPDYTEWTTSPFKEYTNLKEGSYTFHVQATDNLNQLSTSYPLYVTVKPPFHRGPLAKILYTLLALALLYFLYKLNTRRVKKHVERVQTQKDEELISQKEKLKQLQLSKAEELEQLKQDKIELELDRIKTRLETSTMNLVVKNEFIGSIKENLNTIKKEQDKSKIKRSLEKMIKEIDATLRLQEDWTEFRSHFNQIHGDFLDRLKSNFVDLSPNEEKLCALLRLNLSTKEIANLMNISQRGVEVARYRLRKKLELEKGANLSKFILSY